jgi:hypothetical protein
MATGLRRFTFLLLLMVASSSLSIAENSSIIFHRLLGVASLIGGGVERCACRETGDGWT